jgi:polyhydroxyalkanoate synthesis regulator phasin
MSGEAKVTSWRELLEKTIELGLGAALLTKESATKLVDELVRRGEVSREESKKLVSEMLDKGRGQKEKMEDFIAGIVERSLAKADIARRSQIEELERRLADLERRVTGSE